MEAAEILINVDQEEPSWWVWVTEDMLPGNVEERSGIDNESYVVVSEEHVVDGVADFMAKCIMSNPKARVCIRSSFFASCLGLFFFVSANFASLELQNLTPEELQKSKFVWRPFLN